MSGLLPPITHDFPRVSTPFRYIGLLMLRMFGWQVDGPAPAVDRAVVIAAPHTSNWDFWFGLGACWTYGFHPQWLGKDALFRPPWGGFMRWTGGIAVDRSRKNGMVEQAVESFATGRPLMLMVPAEGTRSWAPYWRSGFYWMAVQAKVPIVCGFVDFARRRVGFGPVVTPTGDPATDMAALRAFYGGVTGKFPECAGPVRLRIEDEPEG
jgi:1-acyl-sn-glycerol-3-phosphate acyltransferase